MLTKYVLRGMKAGVGGGVAFGLFVALVGNPLIGFAETFEESGHHGGPVVSGAITTTVSVAGGALLGVLLGAVVLGAVFYFLEPVIPGAGATKSYVLGTAGFVTVSGAPWLVFPPQPPGVEQGLAVGTRLTWYLGMMIAGALACGLAAYAYTRLRDEYRRPLAFIGALVPLALIPAVAAVAPTNTVSGPLPADLAYVFRAVVVSGQVGLWFVLTSIHAVLVQRETNGEPVGSDRTTATEPSASPTAD